MPYKMAAAIALFCASQLCNAQTTAAPAEQAPAKGGICLFTGLPPAEFTYTVVKELDYSKGSFGSVNDILPKVVEDAKAAGADAVIHYNGAQHFGFFPWRFVRPVVTGTAVKWSPGREIDCAGSGGYYTTGKLDAAPPAPPKQ